MPSDISYQSALVPGVRTQRQFVLRALTAGGAALALPMLAAACGNSTETAPSTGGDPQRGGTIVFGESEQPQGFDLTVW
jgi:hypothetical protein